MQTAARLDFIGLPRLRRCGGSVFCVGKKIGGRLWFVSTRVGFGARRGLCRRGWAWCEAVNCGGEVGFGAWLWIVGTRLGLARGCELWGEVGAGARLWIASARLGLVRDCGLFRRGWAWRSAVDCGDVMTVMRRYRNCVKRQCGKKVRKVANL